MGIHDINRNVASYTVNKNLKVLRTDLFQSINGAKLLYLNKVIAYYRYIDDGVSDNELALMNIWGITRDNGTKCICSGVALRCTKDSEGVNRANWTNLIVGIDNKECTGLIAEIEGIEKLQKIEFDGIFRKVTIPSPPTSTGNGTYGSNVSELEVIRFVIDNGSVYSYNGIVTLDNVCIGNPTHYRASMNEDFADVQWIEYSTNPVFYLRGLGVNRVYFQVKNEDKNLISSATYAEIGWSGQLTFIIGDEAIIGNVIVMDDIEIDIDACDDYTINDSVVINNVTVVDEDNVDITLVEEE